MTMQSAAEILSADLLASENLLRCMGYRPFAQLLGTGPTEGGRGIFVRFNAHGEEYVLTLSGNPANIEGLVNAMHARVSPHLQRLTPLICSPTASSGDDEAPGTLSFHGRESDPRPRRNEDRRAFHEHTFSIQRRPDGLWTACVAIPTPGGPLYLCATADEHAVAQALHGELSAVSGGRSWVGSDSYHAACGQVAQARVEDRLGAALRNMVRDPGVQAIFATAVPMVPFVGPPAALAFQGAKLAMELTDKAEKGDPRARQAVSKIVVEARKGDPNAKRALDAMKVAKQARKLNKREQELLLLRAENEDLKAKLKAAEAAASAKWEESPKEAAEDFLDQWGGSEEYIGLDTIHATGEVLGQHAIAAGVSRQLARPVLAHYFRERIDAGPVEHRGTPEVGAFYHRPMREASDVALRRDYLRGQAIMTYGPTQVRRYW